MHVSNIHACLYVCKYRVCTWTFGFVGLSVGLSSLFVQLSCLCACICVYLVFGSYIYTFHISTCACRSGEPAITRAGTQDDAAFMARSIAEICVYVRFIYICTCRSGATAFTTAAKRMTPPPWHVKSLKYLTLSLLIECLLLCSKDHHTHLSHLRSVCLCVCVLRSVCLCVCVHSYNKN